jgi:hypothetical protein
MREDQLKNEGRSAKAQARKEREQQEKMAEAGGDLRAGASSQGALARTDDVERGKPETTEVETAVGGSDREETL